MSGRARRESLVWPKDDAIAWPPTSMSHEHHHLRHTVGSLFKDLKVPARDAQTILGDTRISTTPEIYTDTDEAARRDALTRLHDWLDDSED